MKAKVCGYYCVTDGHSVRWYKDLKTAELAYQSYVRFYSINQKQLNPGKVKMMKFGKIIKQFETKEEE